MATTTQSGYLATFSIATLLTLSGTIAFDVSAVKIERFSIFDNLSVYLGFWGTGSGAAHSSGAERPVGAGLSSGSAPQPAVTQAPPVVGCHLPEIVNSCAAGRADSLPEAGIPPVIPPNSPVVVVGPDEDHPSLPVQAEQGRDEIVGKRIPADPWVVAVEPQEDHSRRPAPVEAEHDATADKRVWAEEVVAPPIYPNSRPRPFGVVGELEEARPRVTGHPQRGQVWARGVGRERTQAPKVPWYRGFRKLLRDGAQNAMADREDAMIGHNHGPGSGNNRGGPRGGRDTARNRDKVGYANRVETPRVTRHPDRRAGRGHDEGAGVTHHGGINGGRMVSTFRNWAGSQRSRGNERRTGRFWGR